MLENAVRICDANFGNIFRWDGDALHLVATHNIPSAFAEFRRRSPFRPGPKTLSVAWLTTKAVVHVADLAADQAYIERIQQLLLPLNLGVYGRLWLCRC